GCDECGDSGQSGRTAMFEIMPISPAIEKLILDRGSDDDIQKTSLKEGMYSLRMSAIEKMKQGMVSIDEVFATTAAVI
ncbi:MAG: type II secretion system protein GspE, partial [candidate division Zixibacteria bacterium]